MNPMILRTSRGNGYDTGEKHGMFWTTNGWQFDTEHPGNFIEQEVGDDYYVLRCAQLKDRSNFSTVRAYPTGGVGSLGGRYEHNGFKQGIIPVLDGVRGHAGMKTPVFDMREVAKIASGIPCFMRDLPQIDIYVKHDFLGGDLIYNSFLDLYLNGVDDPVISGKYAGTVNGLSYNKSKAWNINHWFKMPQVDNPGNQGKWDGGWSGSVPIQECTLGGVEYIVGSKLETAGKTNRFNLLAFLPKRRQVIEQLNVTELLRYVESQDWISLIKAAGLQVVTQFGNPYFDHVLDGIHGPGNEIWMGEGSLKYSQYAVVIDGNLHGFGKPSDFSEPVVADDVIADAIPPAQTPEVVSDKNKHKNKHKNKRKDDEKDKLADFADSPVHAEDTRKTDNSKTDKIERRQSDRRKVDCHLTETIYLRVDDEETIPNSAGGVYKSDGRKPVVRNSGTVPALKITAFAKGETIIQWIDRSGVRCATPVTVS